MLFISRKRKKSGKGRKKKEKTENWPKSMEIVQMETGKQHCICMLRLELFQVITKCRKRTQNNFFKV